MEPSEYTEIRKELGLSQTALAKRLEVSRETVNKRESGTNRITEEAALAIKSLLQSSSLAQTPPDSGTQNHE